MSAQRAYTTSTLNGLDGERVSRSNNGPKAVWFFRALLLVPFVLMAPEVISALRGSSDGVANTSASVADVLGTPTFLIFILMLSVTPVSTVTGWRWPALLRRAYGMAMFAAARTY